MDAELLGATAAILAVVVSIFTLVYTILHTNKKLRVEREQREGEIELAQQNWQKDFATKRDQWTSERQQWQEEFGTKQQQWREELVSKQRQWQTELDARLAELAVDFLRAHVSKRLETYGDIWRALGAVRDTDGPEIDNPSVNHHDWLRENPDKLIEPANTILKHLYGDAGLVMDIDTRNILLKVCRVCHSFRRGEADLEDLINVFFHGRRQVRADLQLEDLRGMQIRLKEILEEVKGESERV